MQKITTNSDCARAEMELTLHRRLESMEIVRSLILLSVVAMMPNVAFAGEEMSVEEADTLLSLQEVAVTAIKQSSRVKSLPTASTVIAGTEIERLKMVSAKNVSEVAPNVYMPEYGSRMTSSVYVRGIGARIDQPVVGLNVDNVPFLNKDNYDFDVVDIERIEVLRGPQSTLFGRNTMGGLINIYTLSPMKYQGLRVLGEYGSGNTMKAAVSYYDKLSERLAMSVSGYYTQTDGFFNNEYNGADCDTEQMGTLRWKTQWRAAENVNVENVAGVQVSRQEGYPYRSIDTDEINYNDTCFYRRTGVTDGLTVKWVQDDFTLSSISSFQYIDDNMTLDQDFLPLEYFTLTQKRKEWAVTQDVVARGKVGNYSWLGGLFGFYKKMDMDAPVTFKEYGIDQLIEAKRNEMNPTYPVEWDDETFVLGSNFKMPTWGVALYHQSELELGRWTITAGLRLDCEWARLDYRSHCNTSYTTHELLPTGELEPYKNHRVDIDDRGSIDRSFVELLPKLSVTYKLPTQNPSNVYASIAKGYKSGGFNTQMFSDVLQQRIMGLMGLSMRYDVDDVVGYDPEKSINYEIGAHIAAVDNRLNVDAAVFYIDCRDQQLTMFPDGTTTGRIMANAGKTRSYGFEMSAMYKFSDRLMMNASYGLTDARFVEFDNGKTDYSGYRIPYAPRNTMFAGASYSQPLQWGWADRLTLNVNCRGVGSIYWNEDNSVKQPFYATLGASLRLEDECYSVDLWGENLTDTSYKNFYFVSIGHGFYQQGKPARMGVTLRLNFEM